jgi:predicted TIM-barrel enzyme
MKIRRVLPPKFLTAMVAVLPLPGSPLYDGDDKRIVEQTLSDVTTYQEVRMDSTRTAESFHEDIC